uniref:glycosyltransferase family 4 protein n=1 Tax=Rhodoblastus sp. TaxID=1962975 RepID=UPI003F9E0E9D
LTGVAGLVTGSKCIATHHCPRNKQHRSMQFIDMVMGSVGVYDEIVCVSQAVATSFESHPANYLSRIRVVTNGLPFLTPTMAREEVRRRLGIENSEGFLFMAGRLAPQKNVSAAVLAMTRTNNIRLVLAGEGPQRKELEQIIFNGDLSKKVTLLGMRPNEDVINLLYACDAYVQVSMYEGHSFSLLEAIYARCPLLVSDVPTQVEAVSLPNGSHAAVFCDPANIDEMAQAMNCVVFDEQRRRQLASSVEQLAATLPTETKMQDTYSGIIKSLATPTNSDRQRRADTKYGRANIEDSKSA